MEKRAAFPLILSPPIKDNNSLNGDLFPGGDDLEPGLVHLLPLEVDAVDRPVQDQLTVQPDPEK